MSVCMASYNGSPFVVEQVKSILDELQEADQLIIVDDCSDEETRKVLEDFRDPRIKLEFNSTNIGHVKTFEKAILHARNTIVILSDQDDIWVSGRLDFLVEKLVNSGQMLVTSNFLTFKINIESTEIPTITVDEENSNSNLANILGIFLGTKSYYGCTMAFTKSFQKVALPIPSFTESHDLWFAIIANVLGRNLHVNNYTVFRRLHDSNVTQYKGRSFASKIFSRLIFLWLLFIALIRKFNFGA